MAWKKIPPEADYFHCEPGSDYFLCEEGFVIEGRYLQDETPNLDKAIWPTVQGNRAYIRVRRKGVDKKFQLVRMVSSCRCATRRTLFLMPGSCQWRIISNPFAYNLNFKAFS